MKRIVCILLLLCLVCGCVAGREDSNDEIIEFVLNPGETSVGRYCICINKTAGVMLVEREKIVEEVQLSDEEINLLFSVAEKVIEIDESKRWIIVDDAQSVCVTYKGVSVCQPFYEDYMSLATETFVSVLTKIYPRLGTQ